MGERPYMKLWVGDYIADTRHLTTEQHGAYLLLLMAMWARGGDLPVDHEQLARLAGLSNGRWSKISSEIMAFFTRSGDRLTQNRLASELKKSRKNSESAKANSEARWLKDKGPPDAPALQAESYHSHSHREERKSGAKAPYAFVGKVIRLNQSDFDTWKASFLFVDLLPYLVARDEFLAGLEPGDNRRTKWMPSTASDLRNKNADAKAKQKPLTGPSSAEVERRTLEARKREEDFQATRPSQDERAAQVARLLKRTARGMTQ